MLRRAHIVRQRTRLKNQVHAILHRNLVPRCPAADLFGHKGRRWLAEQELPADELAAATALLRQLDFHGEELRLIDTELGQVALGRPDVLRLMTVPGDRRHGGVVDRGRGRRLHPVPHPGQAGRATSGSTRGCASPAGSRPATGGSPRPAARTPAGCWSRRPGRASKAPGPLRAFYQRVQARRGMQIAVVATARKLAVLCWHLITRGEDYAFAQPSLVAQKRRKLELRAGLPSARGQKGKSAGYSLQAVRAAERDLAAQAEVAYRVMVAAWQPTRPAPDRTAATRRAGAGRSGVDVAATTGARLSRPSPGNAARQG